MLLQEFLSQILQVTAREINVSNNSNLAGTFTGNDDRRAQVTSLAINLDTVNQVLLKGSDIENFVVDSGSSVNNVFVANLSVLFLLTVSLLASSSKANLQP